jgi:hypothetical protein
LCALFLLLFLLLYLLHSLSTPPLLSLFTHSFLFDSTEAGDMKEDGGAAVAAADGIIGAVLMAGT